MSEKSRARNAKRPTTAGVYAPQLYRYYIHQKTLVMGSPVRKTKGAFGRQP